MSRTEWVLIGWCLAFTVACLALTVVMYAARFLFAATVGWWLLPTFLVLLLLAAVLLDRSVRKT